MRAIVLAGAGRMFCGGSDIRQDAPTLERAKVQVLMDGPESRELRRRFLAERGMAN